jgi:hypothetical protein
MVAEHVERLPTIYIYTESPWFYSTSFIYRNVKNSTQTNKIK